MYTEDYLADLAVKAKSLWRELEQESGEQLVWMTGLSIHALSLDSYAQKAVEIVCHVQHRSLGCFCDGSSFQLLARGCCSGPAPSLLQEAAAARL